MENKEKFLGRVYQINGKRILVVDGIDALENLLKKLPSDSVLINEKEESYKEFKEKVLQGIDVIYTSFEAYEKNGLLVSRKRILENITENK
jgi:hypothetical protein